MTLEGKSVAIKTSGYEKMGVSVMLVLLADVQSCHHM
jgi:hypothetical protein